MSEKHVSIRWHLQHYMRPHQPTQQQMADINVDYSLVAELWKRHPELRDGRKNIINLNQILMQLILRRCGQEAYDTHLPDFLQLKPDSWVKKFRIFCRFARKGGWRPSCPVRPIPKSRHYIKKR